MLDVDLIAAGSASASCRAVFAPCPRLGAIACAASPSSTTSSFTGSTGGAVWIPWTSVDAGLTAASTASIGSRRPPTTARRCARSSSREPVRCSGTQANQLVPRASEVMPNSHPPPQVSEISGGGSSVVPRRTVTLCRRASLPGHPERLTSE